MQNDLPIYPYGVKEAHKRGELPAWRESFRENCACAGAIEISIREHFNGMHLKDGAVEWVVKQYGYKRVEHVLANTVQELSYDGRFHPDNKEWANRHYVPEDSEHNACFVVRSHPAVLDGFITEYRKLVMGLDLFDQKHCEPGFARTGLHRKSPRPLDGHAERRLLVTEKSALAGRKRHWVQSKCAWALYLLRLPRRR